MADLNRDFDWYQNHRPWRAITQNLNKDRYMHVHSSGFLEKQASNDSGVVDKTDFSVFGGYFFRNFRERPALLYSNYIAIPCGLIAKRVTCTMTLSSGYFMSNSVFLRALLDKSFDFQNNCMKSN